MSERIPIHPSRLIKAITDHPCKPLFTLAMTAGMGPSEH
jgi:hypothetical protein